MIIKEKIISAQPQRSGLKAKRGERERETERERERERRGDR